ncbi:MAG: energy transducer TonB [Bacteroidales bacterium]|nr:energy transducer TonB [Bacteroidales bacterium]
MKRIFLLFALMMASSLLWAQDGSILDTTDQGKSVGHITDYSYYDDIGLVTNIFDEIDSCEVVDPLQVFFIVEDMPEFPGGDVALRKYIAENFRYPENVEPRVNPTVFVKFVVDEYGRVTDPEILRGAGELFDKEALRLVSTLPIWKPGRIRGKPVKVSQVVPVKFVSE